MSTMVQGSGAARWGVRSLNVVWVVVFWSSSLTNLFQSVGALPAQSPEQCGTSGCTLHNSYRLWNDRSPCKAAKVVYPTTEEDIVAAVADAVRANQKMKVSTIYSHSVPKGACPGGDAGVIISTKKLRSFVNVDKAANTVTVQSGITMRALVDGIASHGLALPVAPFYDGVTLGGVIANSGHGSTMWGKGGAVHEYVVAMRLVTPATAAEGYAIVRNLSQTDPDLNAAKVHLGVLGVVSTITVQAEPQFKHSVTLKLERGDTDFTGAKVLEIAKTFQYGEVFWYPGLREVVYKLDNRVPVTTPGDGRNNFLGMQPHLVEVVRANEELAEKTRSRESEMLAGASDRRGATSRGVWIRALKLRNPESEHLPRHRHAQPHHDHRRMPIRPQPRFLLRMGCAHPRTRLLRRRCGAPVRNLAEFIDDVHLLRPRYPAHSLCDLDLYTGILFRFVTQTKAYLGTGQESNTVMVDFTWTRRTNSSTPMLAMDVFQELEQMVFEKHGARPHWGKNRNAVFDGVWRKYESGLGKFLDVKRRFDPAELFSSEWSDAVLGIWGSVLGDDFPGCATEGNCKCSRAEHCAPRERYFCRPGLVYLDARVCRYEN